MQTCPHCKQPLEVAEYLEGEAGHESALVCMNDECIGIVRKPMPKFAGVELTEETMQKTRQWFADNDQACIDEVRNGEVKVNNIEKYIAWREQGKKDALAGKHDHTFAFLQRAHFIQTGECIPLLPR